MFTVAMIGPDGVGKTTVSRKLEQTLPMRSKYVYMGVNLDASNVALPSSRLIQTLRKLLGRQPSSGPRDPNEAIAQPKGIVKRVFLRAKRGLRLANTLAEETYRQMVVRWYLFRGTVVLLDRDFFVDFHAYAWVLRQRNMPIDNHRSIKIYYFFEHGVCMKINLPFHDQEIRHRCTNMGRGHRSQI